MSEASPGTPHPARYPADPRERILTDALLLALAAASAAVCLIGTGGTLRLVLVLAAACLLPGAAAISRLGAFDAVQALGLALTLSLCLQTLAALAMVWSGWWHPYIWGAVVLAGASLVLAEDLRRSTARARGER